ncbi:type VI secretion system Vgr family protein [Massilia sp. X63]|uniref:type VI secretion system Vgr family protein n=1 Tax=Massilia sp. X63 TaxID=3237285 RepID=UPI0034DCCBA6
MNATLTDQIFAALAEFRSASRLYRLQIGEDEESGLLVEAFLADDALQEVGFRDVIALSTDAGLDLETLLGQPAALDICLADGQRERFAGEISEAAMLGSDGGLGRYRIRISSRLWRLGQVRNCRVWQDKGVADIVDAVFQAYLPQARWRWSEDAGPFLEQVSPRSYCCQYRESDLDFVRRLLAEEGLCWRIEQASEGPGLVLFADSTRRSAVPEDASSAALAGIRFHGARSVEESDSIQALAAQRRLHASMTTVLSGDYKAKQAVGASSPSHYTYSKLPELEAFEVPGQYAYADWRQAQHYADLRMQAQEARGQMWHGRSTVRTLRAGTRIQVNGAPLQRLGDLASFTVLRVLSIGVNNMPPPVQHALAELFGPIPELLEDLSRTDMPADFAFAIAQARELGYANCFSAVATDVVWRPALGSCDRGRHTKPVAFGAQSAIVVGADGNDQPNGADELYCDRLGRIRIRFHWQDGANASCWVRVAQRSAGGGMGQQFLPRIGQEVLVQFLENDIDRPIAVGALYNGRGEGGIAATPGGRRTSEADLSCFGRARDHAASGQGNLSGGNGPVWHGASADSAGHRNSAAQWGGRSKEFGGHGYSQLLFDDVDGQGRVQLRSTCAGSELNLGHLIHAADNYRGGFRGTGVELRTDAYGVVRAGAGLLVTSHKINQNASVRDAAGGNAAGIAMLTNADKVAASFSTAAVTHRTVGLAAHLGIRQANASTLDDESAPLQAALKTASGMVGIDSLAVARSDAAVRNTSVGKDKAPHTTDPIIAIVAQAGFDAVAGQSVQLVNGESVVLMCVQDMQFAEGGQMRVHTGQVFGVLGGAVEAGTGSVGLQVLAAKDLINVQAQADLLNVQAHNEINVTSASAYVDWATAKSIRLSTSGGANITIEGGKIKVQGPGKIAIHAGKKSFTGPASSNYPLPTWPSSEPVCIECLIKALRSGSPLAMVSA